MNGKMRFSGLNFPILSVLFAAVCVLLLTNAYKSNDFYIKDQSSPSETADNEVNTVTTDETASVVNINTADISELSTIPGIGDILAARIIEYRNSRGEFIDIREITSVRGIGDATFEKIKAYITV